MKLRYIWQTSLDNGGKQAVRSSVNTLLYILALFVIGGIYVLVSLHSNLKWNISRSLKNGIDGFGYLSFGMDDTDDTNEQLSAVMSELSCIDVWTGWWGLSQASVGGDGTVQNGADVSADSELKRWKNIQKNMVYSSYTAQSGMLEITQMSCNGFSMFQIELESGDLPTEALYQEDAIPVYLGYRYKDAAVPGMLIQNGDVTYKVMGILKKGSRMAMTSNDLSDLENADIYTCASYTLDYAIVQIIDNDSDRSSCYFSVRDGWTYAEAKEQILAAFQARGYSVYTESVSVWLDTLHEKSQYKTLNDMFLFVLIMVSVSLCFFQVTTTFSRRRAYGVLFACGYSHRDLMKMTLLENGWRSAIAVLIALLAVWVFFDTQLKINTVTLCAIMEGLLVRLIGIIACISLFLLCISTILPMLLIKRLSPVELVGGK